MAILRCICKRSVIGDSADYQDERYGKGMRVHNPTTNHPDKEGGWRCTICGAVKPKTAHRE